MCGASVPTLVLCPFEGLHWVRNGSPALLITLCPQLVQPLVPCAHTSSFGVLSRTNSTVLSSYSLQSGFLLQSWEQAWLVRMLLPQGRIFLPQAFAFFGEERKMRAGYSGWIFPWGSEAIVMPARAAVLQGACEGLHLGAGSRQGGSLALFAPCVFLMWQ